MEITNYPFLKITYDEKFPRLLITRRPENKAAEQAIYGAFLPIGMARRMLDLLARTFRLRPCELNIQGDFDAPCPEYFLHRCLAPCVEQICDRANYLESVEIVNFILLNQSDLALEKINRKINLAAEALDYERAADWRDTRRLIEEIISNAKWQIYASAMNDVIVLSREGNFTRIHLTTLRRGKSVGKLNFLTDNPNSAEQIIADFVANFYRFYAPKQIFVTSDFPARKSLEDKLSADFGRKIKILAHLPDKLPPSVVKTQNLAPHSFNYKKGQSIAGKAELLEEIKRIFGMRKLPRRIECFDVAHLAGKEIVAARIIAVNAVLQRDDGLVWEFENRSETAALAAAVGERLRLLPAKNDLPDLLIVDGAKPQINAVHKVLEEFDLPDLNVIGAVKPPKAHNQISHFITLKNARIEFDRRSKAMNFLQSLRDASHTLANETHRELHSLVQIFTNNENAPQVKYLLVPTRYAERGGNAADLSPIRSMTQAGEVILKSKNNGRK